MEVIIMKKTSILIAHFNTGIKGYIGRTFGYSTADLGAKLAGHSYYFNGKLKLRSIDRATLHTEK